MAIQTWGKTFGDAEYTWSFETLIAGSVEKIQTPMALGRTISTLHAPSVGQASNKTPLVFDIGCHDGATLQNVLRSTSGIDSVRLFGLDYKPEAAFRFEKRFRADTKNSGPRVEHVRSEAGDAFSGDTGATIGLEKRSVDYALISHVLYGVNASEVQTLVDDVTCNLLSDRGIAFFIHVSDADSVLVALRNQYGGRAERDVSAGKDKIRCSPTAIASASEANGQQLESIAYPVKTYFEKMTDAEWDMVETATNFEPFSERPNVARNIARIAFIPLRTPPALVASPDERTWKALTQEVRKHVQSTETDRRGGYIEDTIVLQALFNSNETASRKHRNDVERALQSLADAMPDIQKAAEKKLLQRFGVNPVSTQ